MKVTVTQEHIDAGVRNDNRACPIALALRRDHRNVSVGFRWLAADDTTFWTSKQARDFIVAFDSQKPVSPFTFIVRRCSW